jgi:hypothetical protein
MVGLAVWKSGELRAVVARLLRDGTATGPLLRVLVERKWWSDGSPFAACSAAEFASVVIPPDVATIGNWAFSECSGLTQLVIPPNVTTIGHCAFQYCSRLTIVKIPSSVTTIRDFAFAHCSGLTQLEIPSSFAELGVYVFGRVDKLEHLTLVGSRLSRAVVEALEHCLIPTAIIVGANLKERSFGPFTFGGGMLGPFTPGGGKFGRFTIGAP